MPNTPRRLYQTDQLGLLVAEAIVHSSFLGDQELFPAGSKIATPIPHGANQINRTTGPAVDAPWEVIPYYVNFTYWLPDGSQHTITEPGVAPPTGHLTEPPPPTPEQFQRMVGNAVDQMLDELARSWRYQDSTRLLAAKGSSNAKYSAEGTAFEAYWSACWTILDDLEADVLAGEATMPATVEEVLALLPPTPARPA